MSDNFKIRIFQPIVPEYRVALFDGLGRRYSGRIDIFAASHSGSDKSYALSQMPYDYGHPIRRMGPLHWQKGLSLKGLHRGDVVVVCGDVHQISSIWIAVLARLRGIKVVWWGHHKSALANELNVKIRLRIAKIFADVMLCYTDAGIRYLLEHGFRNGNVFATGNTIDISAVDAAIRTWDGVRKFGSKKTLIFCGVLRYKVRVDVLLKALKILQTLRRDIHCVIIGAGEKMAEWKALATNLVLDSDVTWVGEVRGQQNLAPWFLSSDLFVYPGRIGLSIIHAFSFGLPVVLNDNAENHGPEYDAFKPGINGWAFRENDEADLATKIDEALKAPDLKDRGQAGKLYVFKNYSMERMVARTAEAIESAHNKGNKS